jgi:peptidoglycan/xylan/chitin deacetylase (PgdA/CDA1 family)
MASARKTVIRAGLETLYFSGTHRLTRSLFAGVGAILTFHRVRPARDAAFQPSRNLEVTPAFLDEALTSLRAADVDLVGLDEMHRRLVAGDFSRRFVALTFDDGYRDNVEHALPILKRHDAPFAVYVASAFADGAGALWWLALEEAIAANASVVLAMDGVERRFDCATDAAKSETYETVYWWLRERRSEEEIRAAVGDLARRYGIDMAGRCRAECLGWDELRALAAEPLATVAAHTVSHPILRKLSADAARAEMAGGARAIRARLGAAPRHFAYPVGDQSAAGPRDFRIAAELGFRTAVTTRPGVLFAEHARHTTALPRISVNGEFQRLRYLDVLLSGAATALMNRFRRVDAA